MPRRKITTVEFIQRSKAIHGNKYKYWFVIVNCMNKKVLIYCVECCEFFWQRPDCHLQGQGCPFCANINNGNRCRSNTEEFKEKAIIVHGDDCGYDPSKYINAKTKIKIQCNKCGRIFKQKPNSHLNGNGCPFCNKSQGEKEIVKYLEDNNFRYIRQKRFVDCRNKNPLPFDFYLIDYNICIEYDDEGHFKPVQFGGCSIETATKQLQQTQINDTIKTAYCTGIDGRPTLLRITHKDNIIAMLEKTLL